MGAEKMKHALLSASGAARWLECTPSARLEEPYPNESSSYAEEGTHAHDVAELVARYYTGLIPQVVYLDRLAALKDNKYYNDEMQRYAEDYGHLVNSKFIEAQKECPDAQVFLENRVSFDRWVPEGFGTCDCIIIADGLIEVIDFKYGKGVYVSAFQNPQTRLYALGALSRYETLFDIERVHMTIYQPRIGLKPSTEAMSKAELVRWADEYVKPRADRAWQGVGVFSPSDETCRWCRVGGECKARAEHYTGVYFGTEEPETLSANEAARVLTQTDGIKAWLSAIEKVVYTALMQGEKVEGYKLVEGRSSRRYVDADLVAQAMIDAGHDSKEVYEAKILPITRMEAAFGADVVEEVVGHLIEKPRGRPTLAPADDNRPEYSMKDEVLEAFND